MGWLLNKLDHLPEPVRLVTINAVLWGINTEDVPPFDRAPLHDEPIAPKASLGAATRSAVADVDSQVAKRLKIPLSSATLMVFALCEVRVAVAVHQIVR